MALGVEEAREQGLTRSESSVRLDADGSVSALAEAEGAYVDEQQKDMFSDGDPHGS